MKKTLKLVALMAMCSALMVSCKNVKSPELHIDQAQAQNQAMADSVMTMLDELALQYVEATTHSLEFKDMVLTEKEKLVKPDYLFDPAKINTLTTRSQKVNALAMLLVSRSVGLIYDMPLDEYDAAIAKLVVEINHPITKLDGSEKASDNYMEDFRICKERGELSTFWNFQKAVVFSVGYVIAQNPELFFSKFTPEQWASFQERINFIIKAVNSLAEYDESFRNVFHYDIPSEEEMQNRKSIETAKQFFIDNKNIMVEDYNALI